MRAHTNTFPHSFLGPRRLTFTSLAGWFSARSGANARNTHQSHFSPTVPDIVAHQHHRVRHEAPPLRLRHAGVLVPEVLSAVGLVPPDQEGHLVRGAERRSRHRLLHNLDSGGGELACFPGHRSTSNQSLILRYRWLIAASTRRSRRVRRREGACIRHDTPARFVVRSAEEAAGRWGQTALPLLVLVQSHHYLYSLSM